MNNYLIDYLTTLEIDLSKIYINGGTDADILDIYKKVQDLKFKVLRNGFFDNQPLAPVRRAETALECRTTNEN